MAIYNDFVDCYENGMTMIEIAKRNNVSERTIYRYKAYYDKMRKVKLMSRSFSLHKVVVWILWSKIVTARQGRKSYGRREERRDCSN